MGNYFSRQNKESIEIINEIDHVHVIVSNSDKKNESSDVNNQGDQHNQHNQNNQNNALNDDEKKTASNKLETNSQDKNNNISQIVFNKHNDIIFKKNLKKRKCKKNKKKHLQ